ncbi:MAG: RNHCP domain-containing protein [Parcubacteria group bacterium]
MNEDEFICCNCGKQVESSEDIGTAHRNHCPHCLSSLHLDKEISGDRAANCGGCMTPLGLTFKKEGIDKHGREKRGELMIVHKCSKCGKISINRLAADDDEIAIIALFNKSLELSFEVIEKISKEGIDILRSEDKKEVFIKLFGKGIKNI